MNQKETGHSSSHPKSKSGVRFRKWSRLIHRDLSFVLSGVLLIYCISGLLMNHRDQMNPHYTIEQIAFKSANYPKGKIVSEADVRSLLQNYGLGDAYTKHYYPRPDYLKVFIKGGSSLEFNQATGEGTLERLNKRYLLSDMVKLHYNPGKWWTLFSDVFCVAMILVVITGFTMMQRSKGFAGRGGLLFLAGLLFPIIFLLLF